MSLYSHLTNEELTATRAAYSRALDERLTGPSRVSTQGATVGFSDGVLDYQRNVAELTRALERINKEMQVRGLLANSGTAKPRQPIYLVGR